MGKKADPTCSDHPPAPRGTSSKSRAVVYTEDVAFSYYLCILLFIEQGVSAVARFLPFTSSAHVKARCENRYDFFRPGGVPDSRTGSAEMQMASPSDPSTSGGLLRTGHRSHA